MHQDRKKLALAAGLFLSYAQIVQADNIYPITLQHTQTVYVNMGICSANLSVDGGFNDVRNLVMQVALLNPAGKVIERHTLRLEEIPPSNADRHQTVFLESEAVCKDGLSLRIDKATAQIGGKPMDLLKSGVLQVSDFRPMPIFLGKP